MKKLSITITGAAEGYWFAEEQLSIEEIYKIYNGECEIEDLSSIHECIVFTTIDQILVDGQPLQRKGKYIKTKDYFKHLPVPTIAECVGGFGGAEYEQEYEIKLEDDEEFDPMKLHLVKSDYELEFMPYGIISHYIIYDNKRIDEKYSDIDGIGSKSNGKYIIDYELPYK